MRMRQYNASPEYIDDLCEALLEWVKDDDALIIPQFISKTKIGYPFLKFFIHHCDKVCNTFDIVKSTLCTRWLKLAMEIPDLPAHRAKVVLRYMHLYDSFGIDIEQMSKQQIEESKVLAEMKYKLEEYGKAELTEPTKTLYKHNVDKRRS